MKHFFIKVFVFLMLAGVLSVAQFSLAHPSVQASASHSDKLPCFILGEDSSTAKVSADCLPAFRFKVTGKVYDAVTRQGIAGARVRYDNCYPHPMTYTTRADGSYEIPWTVYLTCINTFQVSAPGYQTLSQPVTYRELLKLPRRDFYLRPGITASPTATRVPITLTPSHTPTTVPSVSPTATPLPITATPVPITLTLTASPTAISQPGLVIKGYVRLASGAGVANVKIYRAFANYSGIVVATTDQAGYYQSNFHSIPGDEMVRVWADLSGYTFGPTDNWVPWVQGAYMWRHYYGYEEKTLGFVAQTDATSTWTPTPYASFTPTPYASFTATPYVSATPLPPTTTRVPPTLTPSRTPTWSPSRTPTATSCGNDC